MEHPLYASVKFVKGGNSITVEDTEELKVKEFIELVQALLNDSEITAAKYLTILADRRLSEEAGEYLRGNGFMIHDEVQFVVNDLQNEIEEEGNFSLKSLAEVKEDTFKEIWRQTMEGSLNAPQSLNMNEQMKSVKKELGSSYIDTCNIAYEKGEPVGVVMPHIEPGTNEEGRFFYFGLLKEARGKKKSAPLYRKGLKILKETFGAAYSIGATSVRNKPMLKVFEKTGCKKTKRVHVYKRIQKQ